jgi:hypothetical protein
MYEDRTNKTPETGVTLLSLLAQKNKYEYGEVYGSGHLYNESGRKATFVVRLLKDQGRTFVPSACFD